MHPIAYLKTLKASFTDPEFYLEVIKKPLSQAIKYFLISLILLGLAYSAYFIKKELPGMRETIEQTAEQLVSAFPDDLVITWDKNQLVAWQQPVAETPPITDELVEVGEAIETDESIKAKRVKYPMSITLDYPSRFKPLPKSFPPVLLTLINQPGQPEQFNQLIDHSSLLIVTSQNLYLQSATGNWQEMHLSNLPGFEQEFTWQKHNWPQVVTQLKHQLLALIKLIGRFSPIWIPLSLIVSRSLTGILESLLAFLLVRINGLKLSYSQTLQVSLHILIIAEVIQQLSKLFYQAQDLPLFSLSFWVIWFYLLITLRKKLLKIE